MTQIAIVLPTAPQLPPAGPPAAGGSQQFSSQFEKAVSQKNQKEQIDTGKSQNGDRPEKMQSGEKGPADSTRNALRESPSSSPARDAAEKQSAGPAEEAAADNLGPELVQLGEEQNIAMGQPLEEPTANIFFVLPPKDIPMGGKHAATGPAGTPAFSRVSSQSFLAAAATIQDGMQPPIAEATPGATLPQAGQKSASDTILAQLQQLIENSNEQGMVTITREDTLPASVGTRPIQPALPQQAGSSGSSQISVTVASDNSGAESPFAMLIDGWSPPAEKSDQQPTSLRQNTQQQYYEAKINMQSFGSNDQSLSKDGQQGDQSTTQAQVATGQSSSTPTFLTAEQSSTFAQTLTSTQNTPLPSDTAGTVTLPSGTVIREENVIQQMLERFQISRKQLDTQINIKLHPAELGELKIDLTVKEGSIRANVVAQSQHAQEIIEKNMARLKAVLEDHGFTIEAITVSSKSDSTSDADLFDRQLFSQNEYTPQPRKRRHEADAAFRIDEAFFPEQPTATGVNVKI